MVYDCFSYNGEKDLLEIRLHHHSQFVDKFIITECTYTYSGISKPLYFNEIKNEEPFIKFKDKIIYNVYSIPPNNNETWEYEYQQRNSLLRHLKLFTKNDLILYLDCDEIIRNKEVIEEAKNVNEIVSLDMTMNWYYLNCIAAEDSEFQEDYSLEKCFNHRWHMGKIVRKKHLIEFSDNLYALRQYNIWEPEKMYTIQNSGWHFSNLGTAESIRNKLLSFSHCDEIQVKYDIQEQQIRDRIENLQDPLGRKVFFVITDLDAPEYVLENMEKFKKYVRNS